MVHHHIQCTITVYMISAPLHGAPLAALRFGSRHLREVWHTFVFLSHGPRQAVGRAYVPSRALALWPLYNVKRRLQFCHFSIVPRALIVSQVDCIYLCMLHAFVISFMRDCMHVTCMCMFAFMYVVCVYVGLRVC